jgi:predicted nucleic acid-binding protein
MPVSRDVLYESVDLRTAHKSVHGRKLELPDAIHLATAIKKGCRYFISADEGIRAPLDMKRLSPLTTDLDEVIKVLS